MLYYFNFVQVPAFAEMEAAARNNAVDDSRRGRSGGSGGRRSRPSSLASCSSGCSATGDGSSQLTNMDYFKSLSGISIATGILLGLTMFANVWGIIWRNQKIVIANARNVQAGGEADPEAATAGRKALMASRMNTIFSLPLLVFMVGTAHFPYNQILPPEGSKRAIYWGITLVIWIVLEAQCHRRDRWDEAGWDESRSSTLTRTRSSPASCSRWSGSSCSRWCSPASSHSRA